MADASSSKVIFITGASSGIGENLARKAAAAGHSVVLFARRTEQLQAVAAECGENALAVTGDATKRADIDRAVKAAIERFGRIGTFAGHE